MRNRHFVFFGFVKITKGICRATLIDLNTSRYKLIPLELFNVLEILKIRDIQETKIHFDNEFNEGIDLYINLLIKENWGFITDTPAFFPSISNEWNSYSKISNAIIEFKDIKFNSPFFTSDIPLQLSQLGCQALELRFLHFSDKLVVSKILELLSEITSLIQINIFYPFTDDLLFLTDTNSIEAKKIDTAFIYNSPTNKMEIFESFHRIIFTKSDLSSANVCGNIFRNSFTINIPNYTESQYHNSCLNQKISIDQNGEIKNCPSMITSYGNIKDTSLEKAVNKKGFKDLWNITKSKIGICKDCEFRDICTDCRAYLQDPNDIYSKPLKCGYDPYTNKWEDWTTNPLSKIGIEHYSLQELIKTTNE